MSEVKITVGESFDDLIARAEDAERRSRAGLITKDEPTYINFESWEQLTSTLTPKRLEVLRYLHRNPAASVRRAAADLGRSYANVHADVEALTAAGLVERDENGLHAQYDEITARIAL